MTRWAASLALTRGLLVPQFPYLKWPVMLPDTSLGFRKGALIRDPDGHVLLIAEP